MALSCASLGTVVSSLSNRVAAITSFRPDGARLKCYSKHVRGLVAEAIARYNRMMTPMVLDRSVLRKSSPIIAREPRLGLHGCGSGA